MFDINGLQYIPQYLPRTTRDQLLKQVDSAPWRDDLSRRTQHYGYVYDYRAKRVDPEMYLGALPDWLRPLSQQLYQDNLIPSPPDQAIINEYEPGQGIPDHIDCTPCFGDTVISLSLGGTAVINLKQAKQTVPILLESGSLLILQKEARYQWTHGIPKRKSDRVNGRVFPRQRRISITFRKVILDQGENL